MALAPPLRLLRLRGARPPPRRRAPRRRRGVLADGREVCAAGEARDCGGGAPAPPRPLRGRRLLPRAIGAAARDARHAARHAPPSPRRSPPGGGRRPGAASARRALPSRPPARPPARTLRTPSSPPTPPPPQLLHDHAEVARVEGRRRRARVGVRSRRRRAARGGGDRVAKILDADDAALREVRGVGLRLLVAKLYEQRAAPLAAPRRRPARRVPADGGGAACLRSRRRSSAASATTRTRCSRRRAPAGATAIPSRICGTCCGARRVPRDWLANKARPPAPPRPLRRRAVAIPPRVRPPPRDAAVDSAGLMLRYAEGLGRSEGLWQLGAAYLTDVLGELPHMAADRAATCARR